jgi:hypothetical protein
MNLPLFRSSTPLEEQRALNAVANGVWHKHVRVCLRGIVLHSQQYSHRGSSNSFTVSYWYKRADAAAVLEKNYAVIEKFLSCIQGDDKYAVAMIKTHRPQPSPHHSLTLATAQCTSPVAYPILVTSIISRVIFIANPRLPRSDLGRTVAVCDDIDFPYD